MALRTVFPIPPLALLLLVVACSAERSAARGSGAPRAANAIVVTSEELLSRGAGELLGALRGLVSNLRIERANPCPHVSLRGERSIYGRPDPAIYVDGTRASNTCVLEQIPTRAVERVEIYPSGSPGPGYIASATGSILIFLTAQ